jgi:hypothetical protein
VRSGLFLLAAANVLGCGGGVVSNAPGDSGDDEPLDGGIESSSDGSSSSGGSNGSSSSDGGDSSSSSGGSSGDSSGSSSGSTQDAGCSGNAPSCFGYYSSSTCCLPDPGPSATCQNGSWMCGSIPAPGCDGTRCLFPCATAGGACVVNAAACAVGVGVGHLGTAAESHSCQLSQSTADGVCCFEDSADGGCGGTPPDCFGNDINACCGYPVGHATCQGDSWMCGTSPAPGCSWTTCVFDAGLD